MGISLGAKLGIEQGNVELPLSHPGFPLEYQGVLLTGCKEEENEASCDEVETLYHQEVYNSDKMMTQSVL